MHCDLQISVNKLVFERIVQLWDVLKVGLGHAFVNTAPMFDVCALNVSTFVCVDICCGFAIVWESAMVCNKQCYGFVYMM